MRAGPSEQLWEEIQDILFNGISRSAGQYLKMKTIHSDSPFLLFIYLPLAWWILIKFWSFERFWFGLASVIRTRWIYWINTSKWRRLTPGIEVAQKCSVSNGAQADWFCDSIWIWELNHQIILPLLHYWRNIFTQPLSLASTYLIVGTTQPVDGRDIYHIKVGEFSSVERALGESTIACEKRLNLLLF